MFALSHPSGAVGYHDVRRESVSPERMPLTGRHALDAHRSIAHNRERATDILNFMVSRDPAALALTEEAVAHIRDQCRKIHDHRFGGRAAERGTQGPVPSGHDGIPSPLLPWQAVQAEHEAVGLNILMGRLYEASKSVLQQSLLPLRESLASLKRAANGVKPPPVIIQRTETFLSGSEVKRQSPDARHLRIATDLARAAELKAKVDQSIRAFDQLKPFDVTSRPRGRSGEWMGMDYITSFVNAQNAIIRMDWPQFDALLNTLARQSGMARDPSPSASPRR